MSAFSKIKKRIQKMPIFIRYMLAIIWAILWTTIVRLIFAVLPDSIIFVWFNIMMFGLIGLCGLIIYVFIKHGLLRKPYPDGKPFGLSKEASLWVIILFVYMGVILFDGVLQGTFGLPSMFSRNMALLLPVLVFGSMWLFVYFEKIDLLKE